MSDYLEIARKVMEARQPLEAVLKGSAVELWSDAVGRLFIVADQEDVNVTMRRFGGSRGEIYSAAEVRRVIEIGDPATVAEVHRLKREFNELEASIREYIQEARSDTGEPGTETANGPS